MKCEACGRGKDIVVNNTYQVPYVAGYSNDGKTIYIDNRLPDSFIDSRKQQVNVHYYLILHEVAEKALKDELELSYNDAHSLAMGLQSYALARDDINADEYYAFQQKYVDMDIKPEDFDDVPPDLDISPYIEDGLTTVVEKLRKLQSKGE